MRLAVACASQRGYRFLRRLTKLVPDADLAVFSFREESVEPPFLDDIRCLALSRNAQFIETRRVDGSRALPFWSSTAVDLMFVVGWRYLIPPNVYERPRRGTFVFHDSMLPRYRGFSPTVWAICNGEDHTGASLFAIAPDVDSGHLVDQRRVPIGPDDTITMVAERVTQAYLGLLDDNLWSLLDGSARLRPQDNSAATYVRKREESDHQIDWTWPATRIHNLIRAVTNPYPGARTRCNGRQLRVWSARRIDTPWEQGLPGQIAVRSSAGDAVIWTGAGALSVGEVQWDGEPRVSAAIGLASVTEPLGR